MIERLTRSWWGGFAGAIMAERSRRNVATRARHRSTRAHAAARMTTLTTTAYSFTPTDRHLSHPSSAWSTTCRGSRTAAIRAPVIAKIGTGWCDADQPDNVNMFFGLTCTPTRSPGALRQKSSPVVVTRRARTPCLQGRPRALRRLLPGYTRKHGGAIRRSCMHRCAGGWRSAPTPTTGTSRTGIRRCPPTATRQCSERILEHPGIEVRTGVAFDDVRFKTTTALVTGPIGGYFNNDYGPLPYRSLEFDLRNQSTPGGSLSSPSRRSTSQRGHAVDAHHRVRISPARYTIPRRWRSNTRAAKATRLPDPSDDSRALYRRYEARVPASRRHLRGAPRPLPVPEHGPGGRAGTVGVRQALVRTGSWSRSVTLVQTGHGHRAFQEPTEQRGSSSRQAGLRPSSSLPRMTSVSSSSFSSAAGGISARSRSSRSRPARAPN